MPRRLAAACISLFALASFALAQNPVGLFEHHSDVGAVLQPGQATYDPALRRYTLTGSGENMWFAKDEFHYVWKRITGDFTLTAAIDFPEAGGNAHKKAVLIARQSLDTDSAYADIAVHADGLTSLQARESAGAPTREVGINAAHPRAVRLDKRGDTFFMSFALPGGEMKFAGGSMRVALKPPFYVGIGICAHDKDAIARATFSEVTLTQPTPAAPALDSWTTLETVAVSSTDRRVVLVSRDPIHSAAFTADAAAIVFATGSTLQRIPAKGGATEAIPGAPPPAPPAPDTYASSDGYINCFPRKSPDGERIVVLSFPEAFAACPANQEALLRVLSLTGQPQRLVARLTGGATLGPAPWSPDGKSLTYVSHQSVPR